MCTKAMRTSGRYLVLVASAGLTALALVGAAPPADVAPTPTPAAPASVSAPAAASESTVAILDVIVSPDPVQPNKPVSITVHTTSNVVQLRGRVLAHSFTVPKTGDGLFYGAGKVPWWARFFHGSLNVTFSASDAGGASSEFEQTIRM